MPVFKSFQPVIIYIDKESRQLNSQIMCKIVIINY